jgi:hypothetical protein
MTLEHWAYIAQIVGSIAVVASLMYVAVQLRQSTGMMRAESRNAIHQSNQQELFALVDHPVIWRGLTDEVLDDDGVRLNAWLMASLRAREHEWFQYRHGALDKSSWRSYATAIPIALAKTRARDWWEVMKPAYDREFVKAVDAMLENEGLNAATHRQAIVLGKEIKR